MTHLSKTGLRLLTLCAALLLSLNMKAGISTGWHFYDNQGNVSTWGGVGCSFGLSFVENNDGNNTVTVYSYTDGSDNNANH